MDTPDKWIGLSSAEKGAGDTNTDAIRNGIAHQRLTEAQKDSLIRIQTESQNVIEGRVVFNENGVLRVRYTTPPAPKLDYIDITHNSTGTAFTYQFYGSVLNRPGQIRPVGDPQQSTSLISVSFPEQEERQRAMHL